MIMTIFWRFTFLCDSVAGQDVWPEEQEGKQATEVHQDGGEPSEAGRTTTQCKLTIAESRQFDLLLQNTFKPFEF